MNQDIAALPWRLERGDGEMDLRARFPSEGKVLIVSDNDCAWHPVADCSCNHSCREQYEQEANAAFIVKACNSHEQLVRALSTLVKRIEYYSSLAEDARVNIEQWEYTEGSSDMERARAALEAAEVSK